MINYYAFAVTAKIWGQYRQVFDGQPVKVVTVHEKMPEQIHNNTGITKYFALLSSCLQHIVRCRLLVLRFPHRNEIAIRSRNAFKIRISK